MNPIITKIGQYLVKNAPVILTGTGVAGVVATAIFASKATLKAEHTIAKNTGLDEEPPTFVEKVKLVWPYYAPTVLVGTATVCCILAANSINTKRNLVLAGLYSMAERTISEYQDEIVEEFGGDKLTKIRDKVAQKHVDEQPASVSDVYLTGKGDTLCYDTWTGRYFRSDIEKIRQSVNSLNERIIHDNYANLNELYSLLGCSPTLQGDVVGWNTDHLVDLNISGTLADNNEPCLAFSLTPPPSPNYYSVH